MATDPNAEAGKGTESMRRYGLAVRAAATALLLRELLAPILGEIA
jgi:hypothetical protein